MRMNQGAVFVEQLIVYLPTLFMFLTTYQLTELYAANVLVRHAAFMAARAAVVVLPDDPKYYGKVPVNAYSGARKEAIHRAARLVLAADPHFDPQGVSVSVGTGTEGQQLAVTVTAPYRCFASYVNFVCGGAARTLRGVGADVYQGAAYDY